MLTVNPAHTPQVAETRVRAALNVVNAIGERPHLRGGAGVAEAVQVVGHDLLGCG